MPRYYFDLYDDLVIIDDVGEDLAGLDHARPRAVQVLLAVAEDILPHDGPAKRMSVKVRDEAGSIVITTEIDFTVRYGD